MLDQVRLVFDNTYRQLPERFFVPMHPEPVAAPRLVALNRGLAALLGLDLQAIEPDAAAIFSGNAVPAGAEPIATAYAGHQFGSFVRQLGDGRAILLGEVIGRDGQRRDIQLKGSGPTPFSRRGDGRAALGPVLREYIVSEAMHALGIPTTRALAAVTTGQPVYREETLPGAVLTRVAASHIRVGTFQYFAARGDVEAIRHLADHVIARHYPEAAEDAQPYAALLGAVAERQASLVARWMHVGFIHGVMNTDNMAISGETIDYGPCAFMDAYAPDTVFSSIDHGGRYAFGNQPNIAGWNLARLAETLLPLLDPDPQTAVDRANDVLEAFSGRFQRFWLDGMRRKLGLADHEPGDLDLVRDLLEAMHQGSADYTLTFRRLCDAAENAEAGDEVRQLFETPSLFDDWARRWRERLDRDAQAPAQRAAAMRSVNPAFIPRNHRVEEALRAAMAEGDLRPFEQLRTVLERPFEEQPAMAAYARPPAPSERVLETFCGT
jgi:Uncharacterized conserved protein